jgi:hypothetical protein
MATIQQTYKQVGKYFLNGKDMFTTFGVVFAEKAYAQLLKLPQSRDEYVQVFADQNGSQRPDPIFFQTLTHTLPFVIIGTDYNEILNKYEAFRNELLSITYHLLEVPRLGKLYRLRYSNMSDFDTAERIMDQGNMVFTFKIDFLNDTPTNNSIFRSAFEAAKAAGYDVDENMFDQAVAADLPYSYQKEAEVIFAPGLKKTGFVAGVDRNGNIVEFTATRAGAATYIDKDGLLKTAAANEPRIDYGDGVMGLLVEAATTNLIKASNKIGASPWSIANISATDNAAISLDGTNTGYLFEIKNVGTSNLGILLNGVQPGAYTFSFYVKMLTKRGGYKYRVYDNDTSTELVPKTDYSDMLVAGEFVRIVVPFIVSAGQTSISLFIHFEINALFGTFAADGAQLEYGGSATSLVRTDGAIVVRPADIVKSIRGDLFSYSAASMYADLTGLARVNGWYLSKGTQNDRLIYPGNGQILFSDGVTGSFVSEGNSKTLIKYDNTDKEIANNGAISSPTNTVSANIVRNDVILVGNSAVSWMKLKCMAIFSRKFADQEAIDLTK